MAGQLKANPERAARFNRLSEDKVWDVVVIGGGAAENDLLMQFQADLANVPVVRPVVTETTALGAAYLAGLGIGLWEDFSEIESLWRRERIFEPKMSQDRREYLTKQWHRAVARTRGWEQ
nr:FGGY-family carbohydrate kinase [uncultured Parasutterella sp.]